jgi:hypothetical protein
LIREHFKKIKSDNMQKITLKKNCKNSSRNVQWRKEKESLRKNRRGRRSEFLK